MTTPLPQSHYPCQIFSKDTSLRLHWPYNCAVDLLPCTWLPQGFLYSLSAPAGMTMKTCVNESLPHLTLILSWMDWILICWTDRRCRVHHGLPHLLSAWIIQSSFSRSSAVISSSSSPIIPHIHGFCLQPDSCQHRQHRQNGTLCVPDQTAHQGGRCRSGVPVIRNPCCRGMWARTKVPLKFLEGQFQCSGSHNQLTRRDLEDRQHMRKSRSFLWMWTIS